MYCGRQSGDTQESTREKVLLVGQHLRPSSEQISNSCISPAYETAPIKLNATEAYPSRYTTLIHRPSQKKHQLSHQASRKTNLIQYFWSHECETSDLAAHRVSYHRIEQGVRARLLLFVTYFRTVIICYGTFDCVDSD